MNRIPKVTIVITTYLPATRPYLDLCMRSIEALDYPRDCISAIVVCPPDYVPAINDDGSPRYGRAWSVIATDSEGGSNYSNAHAINVGVAAALRGQPDAIVYANDDVIFTQGSVKNLVNMLMRNPQLLLMPVGNDAQQKFTLQLPLSGPYRYEQVDDKFQALIAQTSPYPAGLFFYDTLCTYAMAFTPDLWRDLGGLDENLKGWDDTDMCLSLVKKGYQPAISLDAIVWHAGGVSADITKGEFSSDKRTREEVQFRTKWPNFKFFREMLDEKA